MIHPHPDERAAMTQATWHDALLAHSDDTVVVENNHYFPPESLAREYFRPAANIRGRVAFWKGVAVQSDRD